MLNLKYDISELKKIKRNKDSQHNFEESDIYCNTK